jgi:hypothetical protein
MGDASVVAVINSVIGGSTIALATSVVFEPPLGLTVGAGAAVGLVSVVLLLRHADRLLEERAGSTESIFPTPADG